MPSVMCIAGLDPSGHAGLSADLRALSFLGIKSLPIASTLTVQTKESFSEFQPVPVDFIQKQMHAVLKSENPEAIKVGVLGSAEIASAVAEMLDSVNIPSVVDPVFASSTGYSLIDDELLEVYRNGLLPVSHLVTPNAHEASILAGMKVVNPETAVQAAQIILDLGPKAVLVKGGHFSESKGTDVLCDRENTLVLPGKPVAGKVRGTGCTYSALIAGYLSMGLRTAKAVKFAKSDMSRVLAFSARQDAGLGCFEKPLAPENQSLRTEVSIAVSELMAIMTPDMIAEVGNNLAYGKESASGYDDVCTLDSRIVLKNERPATMGVPVFGRESHTARIVLAAMAKDPKIRCALNIRFSDPMLARMKSAGMKIGSFDRSEEPRTSSSMEWGTGKAINDLGYVPDAIYDMGSKGKEPMIRLLASTPGELIRKLEKLTERE